LVPAGWGMAQSRSTESGCSAPFGHHGNILLAFKAMLPYYLSSVLWRHKTFLVITRLSRRFFCIVLLHLLLLHTVRMTWRSLPRLPIRGLSREHLCEQYCVHCHDSGPPPAL